MDLDTPGRALRDTLGAIRTPLNQKKMEMDGATLTIGIISIVLFALPFALDYRSRRKKKAHLLSALHDAAALQQRKLGYVDMCNGIAMGMDQGMHMLFYYNGREANATVQHVDLSTLRSCHALRDGRMAKADDAEGMPTSVELCLVTNEKNSSEIRLVLYRSAHGTTLNGEVQFADNWARLINGRPKGK